MKSLDPSPWTDAMDDAEAAIWDRTVRGDFTAAELDTLRAYCRHVAAADRLSESISKWSELDPIAELQTLLAMRKVEAAAAVQLAKALGLAG